MLDTTSLESLAMHAAEIQEKGEPEKLSLAKRSISPDGSKSTKKPKRRGSRVNKGLRHFSVKVCEKLAQTGVTTYNEIANLLVKEARPELEATDKSGYDEKNIRRRIYDALNVLMAMDIISKEKKKIRWNGIKLAPQSDREGLQEMKEKTLEKIAKKKTLLEELTYEYLARKHLAERNSKPEPLEHKEKLTYPFIIVNSRTNTDISCEMLHNREEVFFNYSDSFSINDDHVILQQIGAHIPSELIPDEFRPFLPSRFGRNHFAKNNKHSHSYSTPSRPNGKRQNPGSRSMETPRTARKKPSIRSSTGNVHLPSETLRSPSPRAVEAIPSNLGLSRFPPFLASTEVSSLSSSFPEHGFENLNLALPMYSLISPSKISPSSPTPSTPVSQFGTLTPPSTPSTPSSHFLTPSTPSSQDLNGVLETPQKTSGREVPSSPSLPLKTTETSENSSQTSSSTLTSWTLPMPPPLPPLPNLPSISTTDWSQWAWPVPDWPSTASSFALSSVSSGLATGTSSQFAASFTPTHFPSHSQFTIPESGDPTLNAALSFLLSPSTIGALPYSDSTDSCPPLPSSSSSSTSTLSTASFAFPTTSSFVVFNPISSTTLINSIAIPTSSSFAGSSSSSQSSINFHSLFPSSNFVSSLNSVHSLSFPSSTSNFADSLSIPSSHSSSSSVPIDSTDSLSSSTPVFDSLSSSSTSPSTPLVLARRKRPPSLPARSHSKKRGSKKVNLKPHKTNLASPPSLLNSTNSATSMTVAYPSVEV